VRITKCDQAGVSSSCPLVVVTLLLNDQTLAVSFAEHVLIHSRYSFTEEGESGLRLGPVSLCCIDRSHLGRLEGNLVRMGHRNEGYDP
jgi:hypothetical protein